jgi:hypothetical protein
VPQALQQAAAIASHAQDQNVGAGLRIVPVFHRDLPKRRGKLKYLQPGRQRA